MLPRGVTAPRTKAAEVRVERAYNRPPPETHQLYHATRPVHDVRLSAGSFNGYSNDGPMRDRLTAGRLTLDQKVGVRIPVPQPEQRRPLGRLLCCSALRSRSVNQVGERPPPLL